MTVKYGKECDVCVINTCAVTSESEKKSRNLISRAKKFSKKVIVTGCFAELLSKNEKSISGVFYIGGCKQKNLIPLIANGEYFEKYIHTPEYEEYGICTDGSLPNERYRAYVKIQDGCNGKCSYCIIPHLRGKSVSRNASDVISEVKRLAGAGVTEIILTGIETSDYDNIPLCELISNVSQIDGIRRIRLGSLNPNCITDSFINELKTNPKLCHHLHISLQSGCNRILNLMRRPYSKSKADSVLTKLKENVPDLLVSADIISGFPTESESDHLETVEFIKAHRLAHVHAFPYSERPYTDAISLQPAVDTETRKKRNEHIIEVSRSVRSSILDSYKGKTVTVLVEKNQDGFAVGHTDTFLTARIKCQDVAGSYIECIALSHDGESLLCEKKQ